MPKSRRKTTSFCCFGHSRHSRSEYSAPPPAASPLHFCAKNVPKWPGWYIDRCTPPRSLNLHSSAHFVHVRSVVVVGGAFSNSSSSHARRTGRHRRSDVFVGAVASYSSAVPCAGALAAEPSHCGHAVALSQHAVRAVQARSVFGPSGATSYSTPVQTRASTQTAFLL